MMPELFLPLAVIANSLRVLTIFYPAAFALLTPSPHASEWTDIAVEADARDCAVTLFSVSYHFLFLLDLRSERNSLQPR